MQNDAAMRGHLVSPGLHVQCKCRMQCLSNEKRLLQLQRPGKRELVINANELDWKEGGCKLTQSAETAAVGGHISED